MDPSDIAAGFVTVHGESPGGLAAVGDDHLANARPAAGLVNDSGVGDLDRVDLDRALAGKNVRSSAAMGVHRERVADRYLGTLPGLGRREDGAHDPPAPPEEVVRRTVQAGETPQARLQVVYDVAVPVEPVVRDRAEVLVAVLESALRDRIREEIGASYSPTSSFTADETTGRIRTRISVAGAPGRMDEIAAELQGIVAGLRDTGPTEDEVQRALQPVLRDLQFSDLGTISDSWMYLLSHPERSAADAPAAAALRLEDVDAGVVQDLARRLLPADAYVEVIQLPDT